MIGTNIILNILGCLTPIVSTLLWAAIMALAIKDSMTQKEKNIKYIIFWFFIGEAFGWIAIAVYTYWPIGFVYMNAVAYFSYLIRYVLFYRVIILITEKPGEKFPIVHYIAPLLICGSLLIWSFFIPLEVQLKLIESRGDIIQEYSFFSRFFLFKPFMHFIYSGVYLVLTTFRLWRYYTVYGKNNGTIGRPAPWITFLMSFALAYFIFSFSALFVPRDLVFSSLPTITTTIILIAIYMMIGYNTIRRNFMLYIPIPAIVSTNVKEETSVKRTFTENKEKPIAKREYKRRTKMIQTAEGKIIYKKLTQRKFEKYFRKNKPWLNSQLKITDLIEPLETNRTILSRYINQTYGMNFNRYINRLRLKEVERLRQTPEYESLSLTELTEQAGFANYRNYIRAQETEETKERKTKK